MRFVFVLLTVVIALASGAGAAAADSRLLMAALILGFVPVLWAVSRAIERATDRDMWHFSAPYPYTSTRSRGGATTAGSNSDGNPGEVRQKADDRSPMPMAA